MKPIVVSALLALVIAAFASAIFAAPPTGTVVTVAVQGFHCQPCPDTLVKALAKLPGVTEVTGTLQPARVTARLDETRITVSQFVAAINAQPTRMDPKQTYRARLTIFVDSAAAAGEERLCPSCAKEISRALLAVKGINGVKSDDTGKVVIIGFTSTAKVTTAAIAKALAHTKAKFTTVFTDPKAGKDEPAAGDHCSGGACAMDGR
ncbi:MAG TPA: cation transporter [Armatimonadota bacterium]|nr:cation transporter [Armatimonadota bacterium]HOS44425.1 cation transporter [Armatimonadota bacterium]